MNSKNIEMQVIEPKKVFSQELSADTSLPNEVYSYDFHDYDKEILDIQNEWIQKIERDANEHELYLNTRKDMTIKIVGIFVTVIISVFTITYKSYSDQNIISNIFQQESIITYIFFGIFSIFVASFIISIILFLRNFLKSLLSNDSEYASYNHIFPLEDEDRKLTENDKKFFRNREHYYKYYLELKYKYSNEKIQSNNKHSKNIDRIVKFGVFSIVFLFLSFFTFIIGSSMTEKKNLSQSDSKITSAPPLNVKRPQGSLEGSQIMTKSFNQDAADKGMTKTVQVDKSKTSNTPEKAK
ncbi:hypothetical protein [Fluviispira sanaruensis]|uniref:Transmembrane protein n=1 Tax=Fluviispira sanaruensis TaxID=2493639 RepID=A0A4P2VMP5_FLUSA|nr:hypothetical protein [Fluviispira sanaruensis]BBH54686.1 hypothetical protein JCM31447_31600 [Fluviispira sanaruensis]